MIVTFTTVGYGDVSPESHLGKVVCSLAIITGIILLAMPLAIVGNNFSMAWEEREMMQFVLQVQRRDYPTEQPRMYPSWPAAGAAQVHRPQHLARGHSGAVRGGGHARLGLPRLPRVPPLLRGPRPGSLAL